MGTIYKKGVVPKDKRRKALWYIDGSGNVCSTPFKRKRKTAKKKTKKKK